MCNAIFGMQMGQLEKMQFLLFQVILHPGESIVLWSFHKYLNLSYRDLLSFLYYKHMIFQERFTYVKLQIYYLDMYYNRNNKQKIFYT